MRMKKIRIERISLHNFKGFAELDVSFNNSDAVVLGGLNGYGKTTIFDALELLLTGKIQRMTDYMEFHDARYGASQECKPLVFDSEYSTVVIIKAWIHIGEDRVAIFRKAMVNDMHNPVDFRAFSDFMIEDADGKERLLSEEEKNTLGLKDLQKSYSFLNYLSQEEATAFLKRKEADRAKDIAELFNLTRFDEPLDKIKIVTDRLKIKREDADERVKGLNAHIKSLQQKAGNVRTDVSYQKICKESQYWDVEEPKLSSEQFYSLLSEDGLMYDLLFFSKHREEFKQYRLNLFVDSICNDNKLMQEVALCYKYEQKLHVFEQYNLFQKQVVSPCLNLKIDKLSAFTLNIPTDLKSNIKEKETSEYESLRKSLVELYQSSSAVQKEVAQLLAVREQMVIEVESKMNVLPSTDCPLCGSHYDGQKQMSDAIRTYGDKLRHHFENESQAILKQLYTLRGYIQEHFIKPVNAYFAQEGVTAQLMDVYSKMSKGAALSKSRSIKEKLQISISDDLSFDDTLIELKHKLLEKKTTVPEDLDYHKLDEIYQSNARFLLPEYINEEAVVNKRSYLQMVWNQRISKDLQRSQTELERMTKRVDAIKKLQGNLKKLKSEITSQRQNYFRSLLSDIKILFYIYSGRIMQTCYFGRGLFIKPDEKCKHIIFTAGTSEGNDVDALFNMSSGQLVTLVIALLLSLNKLYAKSMIIAIDDPIQTIDDINLWGLIETLRHDFDDHFLLLSTHERDYRDLLAYKLDKWGINTKIVDMSEVESIR